MGKKQYKDYYPLIISEVKKANKVFTNVDSNDFISEANLIFCKCCAKFDPQKARFSTYLTINLQKNLTKFGIKEYKNIHDEYFDNVASEGNYTLNQITKDLSNDAKKLINQLVKGSLFQLQTLGLMKLDHIKHFASHIYNWDGIKINRIISEIKDNLEV